MAKYYGTVGFAETQLDDYGVWKETIVEKSYYGELVNPMYGKHVATQELNDNVIISNVISILADPYANEHFSTIRYLEYMGVKWKVTSVEVSFPRLILTTGEVYNANI